MKKSLLLMVFLGLYAVCKAQDCPSKPMGWQIHVNPSIKKNEASGFKIYIGGSKQTSKAWMEWKKGMSLKFDVPIELRYAKEIWIKVESLEQGKNLNFWTFYANHFTKNWETDGEIEDETSQGDKGN